jgi:TonB family protein
MVSAALMSKPIIVKRDAEQGEAVRLKAQFEAVGAEVEMQEVSAPEAVAVATASARRKDDDDDDDGPARRVLTDDEFLAKLNSRSKDIFSVEKDNSARNVEIVAVLVAIGMCAWLSSIEVVEVAADFYTKLPEERIAKLVTNLPETLKEEEKKKKEEEKKKEEFKTEKKSLTKKVKPGAGGTTGGGGDPRARVTRKGVLGIITGQVRGKAVASADVFGKGGFASGIDGILAGVGGLKAGGSGGVGRKGVAGIGYGAGYGSGFGGGAGGVDDLIGNLMGGDEGGGLALKKKGALKLTEPEFTKGGALTGGRSKASIMRVVMQNLAALRYAYNQRLREKPGLKGKITVKFAIDEFGKVIFCKVIDSTMGDQPLEETVMEKIRRWVFDKIDKPGDITEVVYPFVFSQ